MSQSPDRHHDHPHEAPESVGRTRSPSLLLRLSASALAALLVALFLIAIAVQQAYRSAEEIALQERLEAAAFQVLAGMDVTSEGRLIPPGTLGDSLLAQPQSGLYAGVRLGPMQDERDSAQDWRSPSTIGVDLAISTTGIPRGSSRFSAAGDSRYHVGRIGLGWELADGRVIDLVVWSAEDRARMDETLSRFRNVLWRWLALSGAVLMAALMALLIQPLLVLRRVAGEVADVEAGRSTRLAGPYPRELEPLTANLNALLETERTNVEQYRRALGDLAHSLKTPLAVIGTQLDDDAVDLDTLRDTVEQMRIRVRGELDRALRSGRRTMRALVGVRPVLARAIRTLEKLYRDVDFELDVAEGLAANVEERDLLELVGNLAENAAKYGAHRVRVEAYQGTASLRRRGLRISVDDDGPGMAEEEFDRMLQRGVRGDQREQQQVEGQGLGLAIVERIVSGYSGSVRAAESRLGGLCIVIDLPPEARSPSAKESE
jgi:two-component system sensor histidine kinase PhoQ